MKGPVDGAALAAIRKLDELGANPQITIVLAVLRDEDGALRFAASYGASGADVHLMGDFGNRVLESAADIAESLGITVERKPR